MLSGNQYNSQIQNNNSETGTERGTERRNKRTQKRFGARAQTLILSFLKGKVKIPFLKSLILAQDERWRRA